MPPKRPVRKAAIEAKARFGSERNRPSRRAAGGVSPPEGGFPSEKEEGEPEELNGSQDLPEMKGDDAVVDPDEGKEVKGERQNEGEASTAPVPEKVGCLLYTSPSPRD